MPLNDELQQQLIKDLLIESTEGLDRFDREMLVLEKGQGTPETLNVIFRVIHTIKGTAGCLGLPKIESVAHVGENLLDTLRGGKLTTTPEMITTLLAYADALRAMLNNLENTGNEGSADYSILLQQLQDFQTGKSPSSSAAPAPAPAPAAKQTWGLFDDESAVPAVPVAVVASIPPASDAPPSTPSAPPPPPVLVENAGVEKEGAARGHSVSTPPSAWTWASSTS